MNWEEFHTTVLLPLQQQLQQIFSPPEAGGFPSDSANPLSETTADSQRVLGDCSDQSAAAVADLANGGFGDGGGLDGGFGDGF